MQSTISDNGWHAGTPPEMAERPHISLLATTAVLFEAPGAFDLAQQQRIWALARRIATWEGVSEAVPGMTNLLVLFARPPRAIDRFLALLEEAWHAAQASPLEGREVALPVTYGGEVGNSLADVSAHCGLSVDDVVSLHSAPLYTVFALGSHPGYCYLGGMDPRLAVPRRKVPLQRIPAGAVSIGGAQTGVSASPGPSGWHTIGHTDWCFFDVDRPIPAALAPGDRIRFAVERVVR